jgi:hypothetical protein
VWTCGGLIVIRIPPLQQLHNSWLNDVVTAIAVLQVVRPYHPMFELQTLTQIFTQVVEVKRLCWLQVKFAILLLLKKCLGFRGSDCRVLTAGGVCRCLNPQSSV